MTHYLKFGPEGFAVEAISIPEGFFQVPTNLAIEPNQRIAKVDGEIRAVWDLRGCSAYGGPNGRTSVFVPDTIEIIGKSWDDLAGIKTDEHPYGLLREPRPETTAEKKAREKAEADAAAAAEAERKANRSLSRLQIRLAANQLGLRDQIEALVADPATPITFVDYWREASEYRRSHPIWPQAVALIGKTEADLDALYDLGETLI